MNGMESTVVGAGLNRSDSCLVYDVGLHQGEDTESYLKRGFRVVGIEADPVLAEYCRVKFAAEIRSGQLIVVEGAIAPEGADGTPREVEFYRTPDRTVWGTVYPGRARANCNLGFASTPVKVKALTLANCFERYGTPYYIKIDIEGGERDCLRQMLHCLGRPAFVSIESDQSSFSVVREEFSLLSSLGYHTFKIVRQDVDVPVAPHSPLVCPRPNDVVTLQRSGFYGDELPGAWLSMEGALRVHRLLTLRHFIVGERSSFFFAHWVQAYLRRFPGRGTIMKSAASGWRGFVLRLLAPGWYDTHARYGEL